MMKKLSWLLLTCLLANCATTNPFLNIKPNMNKAQVIMHAGSPDDKSHHSGYEYWIYRTFAGIPPQFYKKVFKFKGDKLISMKSYEQDVPGEEINKKASPGSPKITINVVTNEGSLKLNALEHTCVDSNVFGEFAEGGGCNTFGCWPPGGSCNAFGCSRTEPCRATGCPAPIKSYKCKSAN